MHGSKLLLGVIIVLLIAILINQRARRSAEELDLGWSNISAARSAVFRLSVLPQLIQDPSEFDSARNQIVENVNSALAPMMAASDRKIAAEAHLIRGDLHWTLANMAPQAPTGQTPSEATLSPEDHLTRAKESYERLIRMFPEQTLTVVNARFGLAAIAENRRDFSTAEAIYREIMADEKNIQAYRTLADMRLSLLDGLIQPMYMRIKTAEEAAQESQGLLPVIPDEAPSASETPAEPAIED